MKLQIVRDQTGPAGTTGTLFLNGRRECYTLEDQVREIKGQPVSAWKIPGETAIPRGIYKIEITFSPHFGRDLPLLVDVPGYEGVRIHPGNTAADTEGCILVGTTKSPGWVGQSRIAFDDLYPKIEAAFEAGEEITLEII